MTLSVSQSGKRDLWQAVKRGFLGRCPNCGKGRLFGKYLKVVHHCEACGEEFHHHRADDLPAYLSIVIVGHVIVFFLLDLSMRAEISPLTYLVILIPLSIVLTLLSLQPIKGGVVGLQWAHRMHGFDPNHRD